ncbi:hypothetical protein J4407_02850 [Candidatus Pacearchaeota archaeon]|nr:hypothetical protein [Candidatus Pacearchaeota archaeon]
MKIVFTPDWFINNDVLIEAFSFLILFLFFLFALKAYNLSKKRSVLYLGIGFLVIALGDLASIFTKLVLYYDTGITSEIGQAIITSQIVSTVDIFYYIGFFFHRLLTLLGLYAIYKIPPAKNKISSEFFLTIFLILVVSLLSHSFYYLYYLTAFVILLMIIFEYSKVYKKEKLVTTRMLLTSFIILAVANFTFMFSKLGPIYVISQNIQLVGYVILLVLVIRILKNGTKEK